MVHGAAGANPHTPRPPWAPLREIATEDAHAWGAWPAQVGLPNPAREVQTPRLTLDSSRTNNSSCSCVPCNVRAWFYLPAPPAPTILKSLDQKLKFTQVPHVASAHPDFLGEMARPSFEQTAWAEVCRGRSPAGLGRAPLDGVMPGPSGELPIYAWCVLTWQSRGHQPTQITAEPGREGALGVPHCNAACSGSAPWLGHCLDCPRQWHRSQSTSAMGI